MQYSFLSKMSVKLIFIFCLFFSTLFSESSLQIQNKIDTYLKKDPSIEEHYCLTSDTLYLFATLEDKLNEKPERVISLTSIPESKTPLPTGLSGKKIAIDPGHFGGPLSKVEERFIEIPPYSFDEGTLALMTAKYLKELLLRQGCIVLLTKEKIGVGVYPVEFFTWLQDTPVYQTLPLSKAFRAHYNPLDLEARARKINAFKPDVTVIIHYNTHGTFPQKNLTTENYNMVFIGGSYCKGELVEKKDRDAFLRQVTTSDLENSERLSSLLISRFEKYLSVKAIHDSMPLDYLTNLSLFIEKGVYARNLTLTRFVEGPLAYGESLCQDNEKECESLAKKEFEIDGLLGPLRVKKVGESYFDAIYNYFAKPL